MKLNRRTFIRGSVALAGVSALHSNAPRTRAADVTDEALEQAAARPVLEVSLFKEPVIIDSIELLKKGRDHFVRVRAKNGAEGVSLDNARADILHPILNKAVIPYFIGKDARALEDHLFGVYRHNDNYKLQGLALWCPVAWVEFAILDLLGRISGKSIANLLGGVIRPQVPVYIASGRRDTTPQQEVEYLQQLLAETGAKAVKYRIGGRMSRNQDAMPGRTETLIPLSRKVLGDKIAIHADSNSSYDPPQAIKVGRLLEEIDAVYYEEPCPFDHLEPTKKVADALTIPVAGGEQEYSHWRFHWAIRYRGLDIVQPDLHYYGGMIRSIRVANMAELRDMPTTVHISGGFGFVYMLHFAARTKNIGPWQEYKKGLETYGPWFDPPLRMVDGSITVPNGPGVGITDPKELLKGAQIVRS